MKWNKLTTRNIAEDEKEYYNGGIEFVWDGKTPEIDEEVLVYNPKTQDMNSKYCLVRTYLAHYLTLYSMVRKR